MLRRILAPWRELARVPRLALVLLLVAATALDFWYAFFWADEGRFYDEQYNVRNVSALVSGQAPQGMNGFYPAVTWAPQAALLAVAERLAPIVGASFAGAQGEHLTPAGLRVARGSHVLMGTATLFALFLLAGRLFDRSTALAATALLAVSPWHLHASAVFKPDAPLAFAWALAVLCIVDAAVAPSRAGYLAMAATIALAFSCKQTGVALAVPAAIVVATQIRRPEVLRRWVPAATAVGLALIALLNASQLFFLEDLETIFRFYAHREQQGSETRLAAVAQLVEWLRDGTTFGPLVAALAAFGLLLWGAIALRDLRRRSPLGLARAVSLVAPFAFVGLYLVVTAHFKANNFVPLLQPLALAAALPVAVLTQRIAARLRRGAVLALLAPAMLALAWRGGTGFDYVHCSVTPTTLDVLLAEAAARGLLPRHHVVLSEWGDAGAVRFERECDKLADLSVVVDVERLSDLPAERRERADAEVRRAASRPPGDASPGEDLEVGPRWLRVRGPALVGRFHSWGEPEEIGGREHKGLKGDDRWQPQSIALAPAPRPGDALQVVSWLRHYAVDPYSSPRVWIGGEAIGSSPGLDQGSGDLWATERIGVGSGPPPEVRFQFPDDRYRAEWAVSVFRWPARTTGAPR